MNNRSTNNNDRWRLRSQRFLSIALWPGIVIFAVSFGWWISQPSPAKSGKHASAGNYPRAWGPSSSANCGTTGRPPPPVDSPFGKHLYANTSRGVIHPLPAMVIADTLMPPPESARHLASPATTTKSNAPGQNPGVSGAPGAVGQMTDTTTANANAARAADARVSNEKSTIPKNETAQDDVAAVGQLLEEYRRVFGAMPVGELNDEIVRRLQGDNPLGIAVLPKDHPALSAEGELLDRWGTPYRFHPESAWVMTVRSAGPDKRMWTSDDIVSTEGNQPTVEGLFAGSGGQ